MNKKLTKTLLGDVCQLHRGYDLPNQNRIDGPYPVIREPLINHRYFITIDKSVRESSLSRAFSGFGFPVIRS